MNHIEEILGKLPATAEEVAVLPAGAHSFIARFDTGMFPQLDIMK